MLRIKRKFCSDVVDGGLEVHGTKSINHRQMIVHSKFKRTSRDTAGRFVS